MNAVDYFFENTRNLEREFLKGKEEISFKELHQYSLSLSKYLSNSIGEGKNIILISENNRFFIIVYLAIIKSGNICIPIDTLIEKDSFNYIKKLTDPALIFLTDDIKKKLPVYEIKSILLDNLSQFQQSAYHEPDLTFNSERCAEIIFTSGSTGIPKGVMISHKNIMANTESIVGYLDLSQHDCILVVLPFHYCYGLSLLHTHLRVGGSIVLNNSFIFLGTIINNLIDFKCTGFAGVPSHFQMLLRMSESFKQTRFPDLRYVTQAGGNLPTVFVDEFRESFPHIKFFIMYGQTEATARLSYLQPELYEQKKGSIGKAITGVRIRIVNENEEDIKPGEIGELIAKGDNIMMGYYKDPYETKDAIRNSWLYTGDLGTVDKEGYIYLTARKKGIIKVRGKRISPKEIEEIILRLPGVIDCTINCVVDKLLGEAIKATIVARNDTDSKINKDTIRQYCLNHLPPYKIPQIFDFQDKIAVNSSGKKVNGQI